MFTKVVCEKDNIDIMRLVNKIEQQRLYGFIYITTNMYNGKRYIGQKKFDGSSRWKSYLGSGHHLIGAIKKYGRENFHRDIVATAMTLNELNDLEEKWIHNLNAVESEDFYNLMCGGDVIDALNKKNSLQVICIDNNEVFNSIVDASIHAGTSTSWIVSSFNREHSLDNWKNEYAIYRPIKELEEGCRLCVICGNNFIIRGRKKYCSVCSTNMKKRHKKQLATKKHLAKLKQKKEK